MNERNVRRAADEGRRYRLHNETLTPDVGLVAEEYLAAPRAVRRAITFSIVGVIMLVPIVAIIVALLR